MKLTDSELTLIRMLESCGGSYCGDAGSNLTKEIRRISKGLERKGLLIIEGTDAGPRFTLRESIHAH
jgi:hypothetical protein